MRISTRRLRPGFVRCAWLWLSLVLVFGVGGCSGSPYQKSQPYTIPRLRAPHLRWLAAVSRIPQSDGTKGGVISGLTAFHRPGTATPQFIANIFPELYLINADGSGLHLLAMGGHYCLGAAAVTADGQWIACDEKRTTGDDRLLVAALQPTGVSQAHEIKLSALPFYRELSCRRMVATWPRN